MVHVSPFNTPIWVVNVDYSIPFIYIRMLECTTLDGSIISHLIVLWFYKYLRASVLFDSMITSFKHTWIYELWSYKYNLLFEIALKWTLTFMDQINKEIYKNWYSTNFDKTTEWKNFKIFSFHNKRKALNTFKAFLIWWQLSDFFYYICDTVFENFFFV